MPGLKDLSAPTILTEALVIDNIYDQLVAPEFCGFEPILNDGGSRHSLPSLVEVVTQCSEQLHPGLMRKFELEVVACCYLSG